MKIFFIALLLVSVSVSVATARDNNLGIEAEMLIETTNKGNKAIARLLRENDNSIASAAGRLPISGVFGLMSDYEFSYMWERNGDVIFRRVILLEIMPVINLQRSRWFRKVDHLEYHIDFLVEINIKTQVLSFKYLRYGKAMNVNIINNKLSTTHLEITREACYKVVHNGSEFPFKRIKDEVKIRSVGKNKWNARNGYIKFLIESEPGDLYQLLKIQ